MEQTTREEIIIAGGGIIGLSLGLELQQRGARVTVIDRQLAMKGASWAAGGMLAADDPEHPMDLRPLAQYSRALYPEYLRMVEQLSGHGVPLRTRWTLQQTAGPAASGGWPVDAKEAREWIREWIPGLAGREQDFLLERLRWMEEDSLDPRDLCRALPVAFLAAGGTLVEATSVIAVTATGEGVMVQTEMAQRTAAAFVNCCGAWSGLLHLGGVAVAPVKGQMVAVHLEPERLRCVLRTPAFYAIPRGDGRVAIGATVERAGFDTGVQPERVEGLVRTASEWLPELRDAPVLESWAGLRPGTPDGLPVLGRAAIPHCWQATGHYRNGILLAPGTARLMAQEILGERAEISLEAFRPERAARVAAGEARG